MALTDEELIETIYPKYQRLRNISRDLIKKYGYLPRYYNEYNAREVDTIAPTVTLNNGVSSSGQVIIVKNDRIRKMSSLEAWRLMGMIDSDYEKASPIVSDRQLHRQAGNAIVVDVLERIFTKLLTDE